MKILVVNGPNLALLGKREPEVYGHETLEDIVRRTVERGAELGVEVDAVQSDEEGVLVNRIGRAAPAYDGLIVNPAGYTHTSVALRDALAACGLPCVEVHLSNIYRREPFRHRNVTAAACLGQIAGLGGYGYVLALEGLVEYHGRRTANKGSGEG